MGHILQGDCIDVLEDLHASAYDSLITDPPAGIAFMGKDWDKDKGGRDAWIKWMTTVMKECLRVLKPGAHGFVWALPRTSHWTATACENAGFQIRDIVTHLFGSGFPKSHNIGKKAKDWDGWGTALKPASEHWILVRKPLSEKTIVDNVLKHGTGGINIDASRVELPSDDPQVKLREGKTIKARGVNDVYSKGVGKKQGDYFDQKGRFPANLILSHSEGCVLKGEKKVKGIKGGELAKATNKGIYPHAGNAITKGYTRKGFSNKDGTETVADWDCVDDCAVNMLDKQSGELKPVGHYKKMDGGGSIFGGGKPIPRENKYSTQSGGASRFFYVAKASKSERGKENNHPCVKSLKLMKYLITMITPAKGKILDPFAGSGSTCVAASQLGFDFLGIEKENEYVDIARARVKKGL